MLRGWGPLLVAATTFAVGCGDGHDGPPSDVPAAAMGGAGGTGGVGATGGTGGTTGGTSAPSGGVGGTTGGTTGATGGTMSTGPTDSGAPSCFLEVAIECDGDEDCTGGQLCCGDYDSNAFTYTAITCQDTCDSNNSQYKLCHPGESCPESGHVCRHSQVIPHDFVSVCAPSATVPSATGGPAGAGIQCGDVVCSSGRRCCLSGTLESGTGLQAIRNALDPYCVDSQSECACGGGSDADAGSDDAG